MVHRQMQLLNISRDRLRNTDAEIADLPERTASRSRQRERGQAPGTGDARRLADVARIARGADPEEAVPGASVAVHLLGVNQERIHVVEERGGQSGMLGQRDSRQSALKLLSHRPQLLPLLRGERTPEIKSLHQFSHNMIRVRRRTAVSADQQLAARGKRSLQRLIDRPDGLPQRLQRRITANQPCKLRLRRSFLFRHPTQVNQPPGMYWCFSRT